MNLTLIRDYQKEGWESIEVYANNVASSIRGLPHANILIRDYRAFPAVARYFGAIHPLFGQVYRFAVNPIGAYFSQGDVNHIVDQSNAHMLLYLDRKKTVITCHDILPIWYKLRFPEQSFLHSLDRRATEFLTNAYNIMADSEFTKSELIRILNISSDVITVIPLCVESSFTRVSQSGVHAMRKKYQLPPRYILHVGSVLYHKNILYLLRIFANLKKKDASLYFVKSGAMFTQEQHRLIRSLGIEKSIMHLGFVPRSDLPSLYSGATACVQPSIYEGFGLTVLEAMSCGCPVIVSDIPVFAELFRSGSVFIHQNDITGTVKIMQSILSNTTKQRYMSAQSIRTAARFSPAQIGRTLMEYYTRMVRGSAQ